MKSAALLAAALCFTYAHAFGQRTDLAGLKICIDPGHGGHSSDDRHVVPDPGIDFWESESNFQKALLLRSMLVEYGATVILTRTSNDTTYGTDDEPSLAARVETANSNNVDWFHSIHSNATGGTNTSTNYTLMLVREMRPGGPASSTGNGLGVPEYPEDVTMSNLMGPSIKSFDRTTSTSTWLDWTFYGGVNGGFSLGVLRGLLMPGELSEGSFHDFSPETRRLMNNDYRKMEAYALRNAFLQYFGVPPDQHSIIAGVQTDISTGKPVNGATVRLLPGNRIYQGDSFNNGYYLFDNLAAGTYTLRFETNGFALDSIMVSVNAGEVRFVDHALQASGPPRVVISVPVNGDSAVVPSVPITLSFSRPMDTASVDRSFSISPATGGSVSWTSNNVVFTFQPTTPFSTLTAYLVRIDTGAHALSGDALDGNGDGSGGDPYVMGFKTKFVDVIPPKLLARFPDSGAVVSSPFHIINLVFDEPLTPSSVNSNSIIVQQVGGTVLSRTFQYWEADGRGGVNVYVQGGLHPSTGYRVLVKGVADLSGNAIPSTQIPIWNFTVASVSATTLRILDSLNTSSVGWSAPLGTDGTVGADSALFTDVPAQGVGLYAPDRGCSRLVYSWTSLNVNNLIRVEAPPAVREFAWSKSATSLQCYINGDGGNTRFRFVVRDSVSPGSTGQSDYEVGPWVTVDWVGWRLVEWNFEIDSVGSWRGDGVIDGSISFDGFQFSPNPGSGLLRGQIGFNQLSVVTESVLGVPRRSNAVARTFALDQNYPNPFNPSTVISGQLTADSWVKLVVYDLLGRKVVTLADGRLPAGKFSFTFDGTGLSGGVYFCRMTAGPFAAVRKMILIP